MLVSQKEGLSAAYHSLLATDANQVAKNLYIGDRKCAANFHFLQQLGIHRIVIAGE